MNDEQIALGKQSSDRLLEITGELLKMTQVEAGKLQLNPKITKPIELIDYAIKANRVQAERFNCAVTEPITAYSFFLLLFPFSALPVR